MKRKKNPLPDARKSLGFPLKELLPKLSNGALQQDHLEILVSRMKEAKMHATNGSSLSAWESERFAENCQVLKKVSLGLEIRNHLLLEIFETNQWRAHYQTVETFAKEVADMSKGQLMKCIDSARIAQLFHDAGMRATAPTGRQVELLAMVTEDHRIAAWVYAMRVLEVDGTSDENVRVALRDYCRDRNLQFGRRKPNGYKNIGFPSSFLLSPPTVSENKIVEALECEKTASPLGPENEVFLCSLISKGILTKAEQAFRRKSVQAVVSDIVEKLCEECHADPENERISSGMDDLASTQPELVARLRMASWRALTILISNLLEKRIADNQKACRDTPKASRRIKKSESLEESFPTIR